MADKACKYRGENNEFCGYVKNCEDCDRFNSPAANNTATERIRLWHMEHYYSTRPTLFVRQLVGEGLNQEQVAAVLDVTENICPHCWDFEVPCCCWDDS